MESVRDTGVTSGNVCRELLCRLNLDSCKKPLKNPDGTTDIRLSSKDKLWRLLFTGSSGGMVFNPARCILTELKFQSPMKAMTSMYSMLLLETPILWKRQQCKHLFSCKLNYDTEYGKIISFWSYRLFWVIYITKLYNNLFFYQNFVIYLFPSRCSFHTLDYRT